MKRVELRDRIESFTNSARGHHSQREVFGQRISGGLPWMSQGSTISFGRPTEDRSPPGAVLSSDAQPDCDCYDHCLEISVGDFVERIFVPGHALAKRAAGRTHVYGILKHIVTPKRVDQAFGLNKGNALRKVTKNSAWPYLDTVRLRDVRVQHIQAIISAALERGYSTQTVRHIRSVASLIFAHAEKHSYFVGDNPARAVVLPNIVHRQSHMVTAADLKRLIKIMRYPEREIALLAILTGMKIGEICGLQWKYVNLSNSAHVVEGESIQPRTIAIRKQSYRCEFGNVKSSCRRELPIPDPLLALLQGIKRRQRYASGRDFVLISRNGTAINQDNVAARRLKEIGKRHGMPWLTWQVFRRSHATLGMMLDAQLADVLEKT